MVRQRGVELGQVAGSELHPVRAEWANRSVNYVSWGTAARFADWLHNGQLRDMRNGSEKRVGILQAFHQGAGRVEIRYGNAELLAEVGAVEDETLAAQDAVFDLE